MLKVTLIQSTINFRLEEKISKAEIKNPQIFCTAFSPNLNYAPHNSFKGFICSIIFSQTFLVDLYPLYQEHINKTFKVPQHHFHHLLIVKETEAQEKCITYQTTSSAGIPMPTQVKNFIYATVILAIIFCLVFKLFSHTHTNTFFHIYKQSLLMAFLTIMQINIK